MFGRFALMRLFCLLMIVSFIHVYHAPAVNAQTGCDADFTTYPVESPDSNTMRFAVIGDYGRDGENERDVADWVVKNAGRGPAAQAAHKAIENAGYVINNDSVDLFGHTSVITSQSCFDMTHPYIIKP